ncbi:hypothetical protein H6761_04305 [Candidatus Nomurabacteria bacterium]|nr:hypothetical protein [Candidatus Nomurabacteria bacterium]
MFLTTHTSAAILIATKVSNPILVVILGFFSHFVLDFIPHGEGDLFNDPSKTHQQKLLSMAKIALLDLALALLFLFSFLYLKKPDNVLIFIWVSLASWLPDFAWGTIELFKIKFLWWFYLLHHRIHDLLDIVYPLKYGLLFQFSFIILMLYLTFNF